MSDLDPLSAPDITLRGKTYKLPELELKQVIPLTARFLKLRGSNFNELSEEQLWMMFDVAFIVLNFVDPTLTREEFEKSAPTYQELIAAIPVIMRQGRFVRGPKPTGDSSAGEPEAKSPSTGTN